MKTIKLLSIIGCSLLTTTAFSQNWLAGGNPLVGPNGVNGTNNILGTNANFSLRLETFSIQRMLINNGGTTNANGRIAMGNNLAIGFIPRSRLHLHHTDDSNISIRFSNYSTGNNPGDGFEVGYNATSNIANQQFAEIHNRENTAMKFFC